MTPSEYAQQIAQHAELLAKANGLENARAIVLVDLPDIGQAVGIGTADGTELATPDVMVTLLDAAAHAAREGWRVEATA